MSPDLILFPAIDLHGGQVVRLKEGDLNRLTPYSDDPGGTAARWLKDGAAWLHVINLDGAFEQEDNKNLRAVNLIVREAEKQHAQVQLGGGLRSLEDIEKVFNAGVQRAILGTAAVAQPELVTQSLTRWGSERIAVSLDAWDGKVRIRGWQEATALSALELAQSLRRQGLEWLVFTDIARDGLQTGLNLTATAEIARATDLQVIASGGVSSNQDIEACRELGLAGVIIGRALYEGTVKLSDCLSRRNEE